MPSLRDLTYSIPWNLWLLVAGSAVYAFGFKAFVMPWGLMSGGFSGVGLLIYYVWPKIPPGTWFLILNIPIFMLGWRLVSRRFIYYSLVGMVSLALFIDIFPWTVQVENKFLALLAGGTLMGAGAGITLRSLGSGGGVDIIAIILNQRYNWSIGQMSFAFNLLLFTAGLALLNINDVIYSLAMLFIYSSVLEYCLGMFGSRKLAIIISDHYSEIAQAITTRLHRGVTVLHGEGGYTGKPKEIILTVLSNIQIKRLEELIFTIDPKAFTIIGNAGHVLGEGFSHRKTY